MAVVVLALLVAAWVVVLAPPLLRSRGNPLKSLGTPRSGDSIGDFNYRLGVLGRANGTGLGPPARTSGPLPSLSAPVSPIQGVGPDLDPALVSAKRRRDCFTVLGGAAGITLFLAVVSGSGAVWRLQVLADLLLGAYVALYAFYRRSAAERLATVRYLPRAASPAPELALRRTAGS
ncbi:MAG: hypothetical protein M5T61_04605 [Acidimicrobiia bacterium]|nr:hypothetical protein [Acidimicrobiia bacterium]